MARSTNKMKTSTSNRDGEIDSELNDSKDVHERPPIRFHKFAQVKMIPADQLPLRTPHNDRIPENEDRRTWVVSLHSVKKIIGHLLKTDVRLLSEAIILALMLLMISSIRFQIVQFFTNKTIPHSEE